MLPVSTLDITHLFSPSNVLMNQQAETLTEWSIPLQNQV